MTGTTATVSRTMRRPTRATGSRTPAARSCASTRRRPPPRSTQVRAAGIHANAAMWVDPALKNTCLVDPVVCETRVDPDANK